MQLIPVIDLKRGQVVRARGGQRDRYRPCNSPLCASSDPVTVAQRLLEYCDSTLLYLADLDALCGEHVQTAPLQSLLSALPGVELWLDAGFSDLAAWLRLSRALGTDARRLTPVFASEALASAHAAREALADRRCGVLSLDRRPDGLPDRAGCWLDPTLWPERVIVMALERVGSFGGPDLQTLEEIRQRRPDISLIGAGGIRDSQDIQRASVAGASAWLVASALHEQRIPAACRRGS